MSGLQTEFCLQCTKAEESVLFASILSVSILKALKNSNKGLVLFLLIPKGISLPSEKVLCLLVHVPAPTAGTVLVAGTGACCPASVQFSVGHLRKKRSWLTSGEECAAFSVCRQDKPRVPLCFQSARCLERRRNSVRPDGAPAPRALCWDGSASRSGCSESEPKRHPRGIINSA